MSTQPPQQDLVQRLNLLSRKQLQCLAKHYNVKANIKSSDIVDELIAAAEYGTRQSLLSLLENKPEWVASGSDMFGKENVRTQLNTDEKAADASRFHDDGIGTLPTALADISIHNTAQARQATISLQPPDVAATGPGTNRAPTLRPGPTSQSDISACPSASSRLNSTASTSIVNSTPMPSCQAWSSSTAAPGINLDPKQQQCLAMPGMILQEEADLFTGPGRHRSTQQLAQADKPSLHPMVSKAIFKPSFVTSHSSVPDKQSREQLPTSQIDDMINMVEFMPHVQHALSLTPGPRVVSSKAGKVARCKEPSSHLLQVQQTASLSTTTATPVAATKPQQMASVSHTESSMHAQHTTANVPPASAVSEKHTPCRDWSRAVRTPVRTPLGKAPHARAAMDTNNAAAATSRRQATSTAAAQAVQQHTAAAALETTPEKGFGPPRKCDQAPPVTPRAGMFSPWGQMGTARRVNTGVKVGQRGSPPPTPGSTLRGNHLGPALTPLSKPARRIAPTGGADDAQDKSLEALVATELRQSCKVTMASMQGQERIKRILRDQLVSPVKKVASNSFRSLLIFGPPGCGKTLLASALADDMSAAFFYVSANDLLAKYHIHGYKLIRALFKVAARHSPAVICFDDAHLMFPANARDDNHRHPATQSIRTELLVQCDQLALQATADQEGPGSKHVQGSTQPSARRPQWGKGGTTAQTPSTQQAQPKEQIRPSQQHKGIVVVATTSNPATLDAGVLQAMSMRLMLGLPDASTREELLLSYMIEQEAALSVADMEQLVRDTEGFTCRELIQLCKQASLGPVREGVNRGVSARDFDAAFQHVQPDTTIDDRQHLHNWARQHAAMM